MEYVGYAGLGIILIAICGGILTRKSKRTKFLESASMMQVIRERIWLIEKETGKPPAELILMPIEFKMFDREVMEMFRRDSVWPISIADRTHDVIFEGVLIRMEICLKQQAESETIPDFVKRMMKGGD